MIGKFAARERLRRQIYCKKRETELGLKSLPRTATTFLFARSAESKSRSMTGEASMATRRGIVNLCGGCSECFGRLSWKWIFGSHGCCLWIGRLDRDLVIMKGGLRGK